MGSRREVQSCLVCTAGLLGVAKRTAIGTSLSRKTGMRVYEDACFLQLLQDAWLQEELKRSDAPAAFLAELFKSRGSGQDTPFFPKPSMIVLIEGQSAPEARRQMMTKSAQTGEKEGAADVPAHYIEMLMQGYCDHIAEKGESIPLVRIDLRDLQGSNSTNASESGEALATAIAEQSSHLTVKSAEGVASPPISADASTATRDVWKRLDAVDRPSTVAPLVL